MNMRYWATLICCAILTACASGPAYRAAAGPNDFGYRDIPITSDRIRVSFAGDYGMARETVENFALFRAADVALTNQQERFRITSRETAPVTSFSGGGPSTRVGYGFGWGSPFWGTSIGYSTGGFSRTSYETVLEIQLGAEVPERGPDVYDAREIKRNLSAFVAANEEQ